MNEFFNALKNKRARREYIKSVLVGIFSTGLDFFVQALIILMVASDKYANLGAVFTGKTLDGSVYELPLSMYMTSIVLSFTVAVLANYLLSVFFVFEYGNVGKNKRGFTKFAIFALIGLGITTLGSLIGFGALNGNLWVVKIITTVIVFVFNFFTRKYFVFNIALIKDENNTINL